MWHFEGSTAKNYRGYCVNSTLTYCNAASTLMWHCESRTMQTYRGQSSGGEIEFATLQVCRSVDEKVALFASLYMWQYF
jgi:hypothetical protein